MDNQSWWTRYNIGVVDCLAIRSVIITSALSSLCDIIAERDVAVRLFSSLGSRQGHRKRSASEPNIQAPSHQPHFPHPPGQRFVSPKSPTCACPCGVFSLLLFMQRKHSQTDDEAATCSWCWSWWSSLACIPLALQAYKRCSTSNLSQGGLIWSSEGRSISLHHPPRVARLSTVNLHRWHGPISLDKWTKSRERTKYLLPICISWLLTCWN